MKTALVLSAGGGFGAYQAGAWRVLSALLQPDIVVGASVGSLNGWAIAGGIPPEELCGFWSDLEISSQWKWRFAGPLRGIVDGGVLERIARELFHRYPPKLEYGAVLTELPGLRPRLFRASEMTWRHLYASCAIPFVFAQPRIDGKLYSDGGLRNALPLSAAFEMGADRVIGIDVWKLGLARFRKVPRTDPSVHVLEPSANLGSAKECLFWTRQHVDRWMNLGERDAARLVEALSREASWASATVSSTNISQ